MFKLRERQKKLAKAQNAREQLIARSRKIISDQADLLCDALHRLKRRSEGGQETASLIWESLIDGITNEIPNEFFEDFSRHFFWRYDEELKENELAFRSLLEEATKKRIGNNKKGNGANNNDLAKNVVNDGIESTETTAKTEKGPQKKYENGEDPSDLLLEHLISMLKVACQRTECSRWNWQKEDASLKKEIGRFNKSLRRAMDLFAEVNSCPDLVSLLESVEKISQADAEKAVQAIEEQCSESSSKYQIEDDKDQSVASKEETFSRTKENCAAKCKKCLKSCSKVIEKGAVKTVPPKVDKTGDDYIVRKARSKKSAKALKPKTYRHPQCDHKGCALPTSHYRDWKRDGYRCICGQKFRFMSIMEKHIVTQQEARLLACDKCDYRVSRNCCLEKHKKENHDRPKMLRACRRLYQCMFGCEKIMSSKSELFDHQRRTQRQCKHQNAVKLPMRLPPYTPVDFVESLRITCKRSNMPMTQERLEFIYLLLQKEMLNVYSRARAKAMEGKQ